MSLLITKGNPLKYAYKKDFHFILLFAAVLIFAAVMSINHVNAKLYDIDTIKEISDYSDELEFDFEQEAKTHVIQPYDSDETLDFKVKLPKDWANISKQELERIKEIDPNFNSNIFTTMVEFRDNKLGTTPSRLSIDVIELEYEITARNWFFNFILMTGYNIRAMTVHSETEAEALYVHVSKDQSFLTRAKLFINGNRLILVSYVMNDKNWGKERALQQKVIESFELLNPKIVRLDLTETYRYFDILQFDYPQNWRLATPSIFGLDGMKVRVLSTDFSGNVSGEIFVSINATDLDISLKDEIDEIIADLKERGIKVGSLMGEVDKYEFYPHIFYDKVEVYEALFKDKDVITHEFWLGIMVEENYFYIVTMLTPNRQTEFFTWARNIEAYELLLESFRI